MNHSLPSISFASGGDGVSIHTSPLSLSLSLSHGIHATNLASISTLNQSFIPVFRHVCCCWLAAVSISRNSVSLPTDVHVALIGCVLYGHCTYVVFRRPRVCILCTHVLLYPFVSVVGTEVAHERGALLGCPCRVSTPMKWYR